jgi:hypothetical protein
MVTTAIRIFSEDIALEYEDIEYKILSRITVELNFHLSSVGIVNRLRGIGVRFQAREGIFLFLPSSEKL